MANTTTRKTTTKKTNETKQTKTRQAKAVAEVEESKAVEPVAEETATVRVESKEAKVVDQKEIEIENLKAQIEQLKQLVSEAQTQTPQQIIVSADSGERVWFLWMADVADDNVTLIGEHGEYGRIVGKTGSFYVPKNDLSRVLDTANRYYLQNRWMIVVSGLDEDEREALGVNYKEGELLDQKAFTRITELDHDTLFEIFPALCESHKEMIASRYHEAYENGKKINRQTVLDLNKIFPSPAFTDIIERMNEEELKPQK